MAKTSGTKSVKKAKSNVVQFPKATETVDFQDSSEVEMKNTEENKFDDGAVDNSERDVYDRDAMENDDNYPISQKDTGSFGKTQEVSFMENVQQTGQSVHVTEVAHHGRKYGNFGVSNYFALRDLGHSEADIRHVSENGTETEVLVLVQQAKKHLAAQARAEKQPSEYKPKGRGVNKDTLDALQAMGFTPERLAQLDEKERNKKMSLARQLASCKRSGEILDVAKFLSGEEG